jgi:hypothetical protein
MFQKNNLYIFDWNFLILANAKINDVSLESILKRFCHIYMHKISIFKLRAKCLLMITILNSIRVIHHVGIFFQLVLSIDWAQNGACKKLFQIKMQISGANLCNFAYLTHVIE